MSLTADTTRDYIRLDWWNDCDLDDKLYQTGYQNTVYLAADVGKPNYVLDEEIKKDGNENDVITFQNWKKVYNIQMLLPEYMIDAFSQIRLHDNIWVSLQNGERARVQEFIMEEPDWQTCGCYAVVDVNFNTSSLIKARCCENMELVETSGDYIEYSVVTPSALEFTSRIQSNAAGTITIDWGDNSESVFAMDATPQVLSHLYQTADTFSLKMYGDIDVIQNLNTGVIYTGIEAMTFPDSCSGLRVIYQQAAAAFVLTIDPALRPTNILLPTCGMTAVPSLATFNTLTQCVLSGNALPQAEVDDVLTDIDGVTTVTGTLDLSGGTNAAPSAAGAAAAASLIAKGWTVTTN